MCDEGEDDIHGYGAGQAGDALERHEDYCCGDEEVAVPACRKREALELE